MSSAREPKTLLEAVRYFSNPDVALAFFVPIRWADGKPTCPRCNCQRAGFLATRRLWKCKECHKQFSAKVGTIFEDSPIALEKWLPAMWLLTNCKNGISSYELARALGVTQKTAWFMLHRLRLTLQDETTGGKLGGEVEVDETFIGGKARNMHKSKAARLRAGNHRGIFGKVAVMGLLERHPVKGRSKVRTQIVANTRRSALRPEVERHVEVGATVHTDALRSYQTLGDTFIHNVIDHAEAYVDGNIHTNGLENFWSLLKRTIKGTYVSIEPFHLFRYLDEQAFRFNQRGDVDGGRFLTALKNVVGRRVTYKGLTGHMEPETC